MTIVVGVDGSEESIRALGWAVEEARIRHTNLRAVNVWRYPQTQPWTAPYLAGFTEDMPEIRPEEPKEREETRFAGIVAQVDASGVEVVREVIEGHPAEALVNASKDAELLVVGSRGHGGFTGLLLGSVSQGCVHHGHCPVVVIR